MKKSGAKISKLGKFKGKKGTYVREDYMVMSAVRLFSQSNQRLKEWKMYENKAFFVSFSTRRIKGSSKLMHL